MEQEDLVGEVRGDIETEDGVLVIRRIHVRYRLNVPEAARETVARVHQAHVKACPVARSLMGCVEIETEVEFKGR